MKLRQYLFLRAKCQSSYAIVCLRAECLGAESKVLEYLSSCAIVPIQKRKTKVEFFSIALSFWRLKLRKYLGIADKKMENKFNFLVHRLSVRIYRGCDATI